MNCLVWPDACTECFEELLWLCRFGQNLYLRKSALVNSQPTGSFFFGSNKLLIKIPSEVAARPPLNYLVHHSTTISEAVENLASTEKLRSNFCDTMRRGASAKAR
jgi:hypothetical protein